MKLQDVIRRLTCSIYASKPCCNTYTKTKQVSFERSAKLIIAFLYFVNGYLLLQPQHLLSRTMP
jgi:hypothetical protein